jgi:ribosome-binding factor A
MTKSIRVQQVAELLQHELAMLIQKEISDPRLQNLSITEVELSQDLSRAKVFYTLLDKSEKKNVETALKKATGFLRKHLATRLDMRYIPNIRFMYDDTLESAERISQLLKDVELDEPEPESEKDDQ